MSLSGPGSTIWLDSLSINQNDHNDVASQVAVMGDIFGKAERVSVLLPPSDEEAYQNIAEIVRIAKVLLKRKWAFDLKAGDHLGESEPDEGITATGHLVRRFFRAIEKLKVDLPKYLYWRRAWTFQEWSLAHDIELALDQPVDAATVFCTLQNVKSTIVFAAIMVADYKLRNGQYALMDVGFYRGLATIRVDSVKRLFPFEEAFASYEETNESELRFQVAMPHFGTNEILGLRSTPRPTRTAETQFRARLSLMLDAFAGSTKREATFETDLVCCWASMCNISYGYSKMDTKTIALTKVIRALRKQSITVYNFLVNIHAGEEIDLSFFEYAASHEQCNATNHALLRGAPVFTGRTDTVVHLRNAVTQPSLLALCTLSRTSFGVLVRRIEGATLKMILPLTSREDAAIAISLATSGLADEYMFTDVVKDIEKLLNETPEEQLMNHFLVIASIPTGPGAKANYFDTWAICPLLTPLDTLFVAREEQNGTLVLAIMKPDSTYLTSIIAYLTLTDQQCGTFLIPVSSNGDINIVLRTPQRSDIQLSNTLADRRLRAHLKFTGNLGANRGGSVNASHLIFGRPGGEADKAKQLGQLAKYFKSAGENNDEALETIEETLDIFRTIAGSLLQRMNSQLGQIGGSQASDPLTIDIGHPELISPEQEKALKVRRLAGKRRGSF
jgi:hypothetical protein